MDTQETHYINILISTDGAADLAEMNANVAKQVDALSSEIDAISERIAAVQGGNLTSNGGQSGALGFAGAILGQALAGRRGARGSAAGARGSAARSPFVIPGVEKPNIDYSKARNYAADRARQRAANNTPYLMQHNIESYGGIRPSEPRENVIPEFQNRQRYQQAPIQFPGLVRPDMIPQIERHRPSLGNPTPVRYQESINRGAGPSMSEEDAAALRDLEDRIKNSRKRGSR